MKKEHMIKVMQLLAISNNFEFKVARSSTTRYNLICSVSSCKWMMNAVSSKDMGFWTVRKYSNVHTIDHRLNIVSNDHRQASSSLISHCLKSNLEKVCADHITPKDIISTARADLQVDISYYKAWKSRHMALKEIRGCPKEAYSLLPYIGDMMKSKNPGSFFIYINMYLVVVQ